MEFTTLDDIIQYAIGKEQEAVEFYENAQNEEYLAAMINELAGFVKEEKKHCAMLENIAKNTEKLKKYTIESIPDLKISDYMTEIKYTPGMPYQDLLSVAMKREEQAYKFYSSMAEKALDDDIIRVFTILAQEEKKHKHYFETQYDDYLNSVEG